MTMGESKSNQSSKRRIENEFVPGVKVSIDASLTEGLRKFNAFREERDKKSSIQDKRGFVVGELPEIYQTLRYLFLNQLHEVDSNFQLLINELKKSTQHKSPQKRMRVVLMNEIIEYSKSVYELVAPLQTMGIKTLTRSIIERYIYLIAITRDTKLAKAYQLKTIIQHLQRESMTNRYSIFSDLVDENSFDITISDEFKTRLSKLEDEYKRCFDEGANTDKWYNLDGKTTSIDKLIDRTKLQSIFKLAYVDYSMEVHSGIPTMTYDWLVNGEGSIRIDAKIPVLEIQMIILILIEVNKNICKLIQKPQ
jgi:hypothetical protein